MPADPLLLEASLDGWAGAQVAHAGKQLALLGRVESLRLSPDGRALEGRVRDSGPAPCRVEVLEGAASLLDRADSAGDKVSELIAEMTVEMAMVSANCR